MGLKKLGKKIGKAAKKVGKVVQKAAPALAFIPGVGTAAAMALGGAGGLISGGVGGMAKGALGGALGGMASGAVGGLSGITSGGGLSSIASKIKGMGLGGALELAGTTLGGLSALKQSKNAAAIRDEANPFGQYREQYGDQLMRLAQDPSSFAEDPAFKFIQEQGMEATTRKMASQGYAGSGNMAMELAQYNTGLAATYRGQEMDRLAQLAGASIQPASRASATNAQDSSFSQLSGLLKSLGYQFGGQEEEGALAPITPAGTRLG